MAADLKLDNAQVWDEINVEVLDEIDNFLSDQNNISLLQGTNLQSQNGVAKKVEKALLKYRTLIFPDYKEKAIERATTTMLVVLQEIRDRLQSTEIANSESERNKI